MSTSSQHQEIPAILADALVLSDFEVGRLLLGLFIHEQATELGVPTDPIPPEFSARVVEKLPSLEAQSANNSAVEKALHKAASGDFEFAGRLIREHLLSGAEAIKFVPIGKERLKQAQNFGEKGAKQNKSEGAANRKRVEDLYKSIRSKRSNEYLSQNRIAQLIAACSGMKVGTIRTHLTKLSKENKLV